MHTNNPIFSIDFYKSGHKKMYPVDTELIFSNFTARKSRLEGIDYTVFFGLQYFIKEYLIKRFNEHFFSLGVEKVIAEYQELMDSCLGPNVVTAEHIRELHNLGYLPLTIYALPEGTSVPTGIPSMVWYNTLPRFYWLVNYLETIASATLWQACTSATIAKEYKKIFQKYAEKTGVDPMFLQFQGHDFSYRGMGSHESAMISSAGHLLSFSGTDTVPAIVFLKEYYHGNIKAIGGSVPATEHSVMCVGLEDAEEKTISHLLDKYPTGILSVVSDTWDYWKVVSEILPKLKDKILARDGKLVIRPDSGDPELIICGNPQAPKGTPEHKGTIRCLYDTFGGTTNTKGYIQLNPKIGTIYGDSITRQMARSILRNLYNQGWATNCIVFGIGSYTYQYNTRDTFGFAIKATYAEIGGRVYNIYKNPKTDTGKRSAKGLLAVKLTKDNKLVLHEEASWSDVEHCMFRKVFHNGKLYSDQTLEDVRNKIRE